MTRFLLFISLVSQAQAITAWVSNTGAAATWASCQGSTPKNGTAACSVTQANVNAAHGDTVYFRGGTYTLSGASLGSAILPTNNGTGTGANRIIFKGYPGETPILVNGSPHNNRYGIHFVGKTYFQISGFKFVDWDRWAIIELSSSYNEFAFNEFYNTQAYYLAGGSAIGFIITGSITTSSPSIHNWTHHNTFHNLSAPPPAEQGDAIKIGSFTAFDGDSNHNTQEYNLIYSVGHTCTDDFTHYGVWRGNICHQEGFKDDSPHVTGTATGGSSSTLIDTTKNFTTLGVMTGILIYVHDLDGANSFGNFVALITSISTTTNPNDTLHYSASSTAPTFVAGHHYDISTLYQTFADSPSFGKFGHRVFENDSVDRQGNDFRLFEGNKGRHSSPNPANNGLEGFSLTAGSIIVRYNEFAGNSASGLYLKNGLAASNDHIYNNTVAFNGLFNGINHPSAPVSKDGFRIPSSTTVNTKFKNNLVYNNVLDMNGVGGSGTEFANNWCASANPVHACVGSGDPLFVNPDITQLTSTTLPDFGLQAASPVRELGGPLTTAVGTGSSSTSLVVTDALYFQDGTWGSSLAQAGFHADWIAIGTVGNTVQIISINYTTNTITLASAKTWANGASVWLYKKSDGDIVLDGVAPDLGANEYIVTPPNPRSVVLTHPRLWWGTFPDTWEAGKTRNAAVVSRICGDSTCSIAGTSATAFSNWNSSLKPLLTGSPSFGSAGDEGLVAAVMSWSFAYQLHHLNGNDSLAAPFASTAWDSLSDPTKNVGGILFHPVSISTNSAGTLATITYPFDPGITTSSVIAVWGVSNDNLNYGGLTVTRVDATHYTYAPPFGATTGSTTYTDSTILTTDAATRNAWYGNDAYSTSGVRLTAWAYFYDWCYDWLVANGHDQQARDNILAGYWSTTPSRKSSLYSTSVRESDFQNYSIWAEMSIVEAGATIWGDDPYGATILDEGIGYLYEGRLVTPDSTNPTQSYTYNMKSSVDRLTDGAGNWEGPEYWRSGYGTRVLKAIEALDTATGRVNDLWATQFPTGGNAAKYEIYSRGPLGYSAIIGDTHTHNRQTGRNNFGIVISNDRFPDGHNQYLMDLINSWNSGSSDQGLVYKLMFYPYTGANVPASHDFTDLPLSIKLGQDVFIRSGWTDSDSYWWLTGSIPGMTHRPRDAGSWGLYRGDYMVVPPTYTTAVDPSYFQWHSRTIATNTIQVFNSTNCYNVGAGCGKSRSGNTATVDGGQRVTDRTLVPPFSVLGNQLHLWSGTLTTVAPYNEVLAVTPVALNTLSGCEYVKMDLSKEYTNNYGSGTNEAARTVNALKSVTRDFVHCQPTAGTLDPMFIFDRVKGTDSSFQKSNVIHTVGPPQTYSGSWTTAAAGIHTVNGPTHLRADSGTARVYVTPLMPAAANARIVGGNVNSPIVLSNCTTSSDTECTTSSPHGLITGEGVVIDLGSAVGAWAYLDWGQFISRTAVVTGASTFKFSPAYDSSAQPAFASAFTVAPGVPSPPCTNLYVYFNSSTNQPYVCFSNIWTTGSNVHTTGFGAPVIGYHQNGGYEAWVDQYGAMGSGGANLWVGVDQFGQDDGSFSRWRMELQPASASLTDYNLTVVTPTTTSLTSAPTSTLISPSGWYGAQVLDASGAYIAMFPTITDQPGVSYTVTHTGTGTHVVTGLTANYAFNVSQGLISLGIFTTTADGALLFTETGGGTFSIGANAPPALLSIVTTYLPNGFPGEVYREQVVGDDGAPPYTWSISSGSLPTGYTLDASTGIISGVANGIGVSSFVVLLSDSAGNTASVTLQIWVKSTVPNAITGKTTTTGVVGVK